MIVSLMDEVANMRNQVMRMSQGQPINYGKGIDEVQERQRRRKLSILKEGCKTALWFGNTFNIDLVSIVFRTRISNQSITLDYATQNQSNITSDDMTSIHQVLFLLDRFAISDEFYHEMSMLFPFLPRSHTVKAACQRISNSIIVLRLPDPYFGAYRPLTPCLQEVLKAQVSTCINK